MCFVVIKCSSWTTGDNFLPFLRGLWKRNSIEFNFLPHVTPLLSGFSGRLNMNKQRLLPRSVSMNTPELDNAHSRVIPVQCLLWWRLFRFRWRPTPAGQQLINVLLSSISRCCFSLALGQVADYRPIPALRRLSRAIYQLWRLLAYNRIDESLFFVTVWIVIG